MIRQFRLGLAGAALVGGLSSAAMAQSTWDGDTDSLWSTGSNWDTPPADGSALIFSGASNQTNTNDTALTNIGLLTLNGASWNITANTLTLNGGITASGTSTVDGTFTLGGAQTFQNSTGTLTISGTAANGGNLLTVGGAGNTALSAVISGAGGLTKSGAGTATLTGANLYTGATTIGGGTLTLSGSGTLASTAGITLANGGTLTIDNTTTNVTNRVAGGGLTSAGGTFNFTHGGTAATNYAEANFGALTLNAGALRINTSQADVGQTSAVTFASLSRSAGGTARFSGTGLGADTRNEVLFTSAPTATNGILPWAIITTDGGTTYNFANVSGSSIVAQTTYDTASGNPTWGATVNARPNAAILATGNKNLNSLTLDSGINFTTPSADRTLTFTTGGVLQTSGTSTIGATSGSNEYILAFGANEALFHVLGTLIIQRGNTNVITGSGGLTKTGAGTLELGTSGNAMAMSLTGNFTINEGTVRVLANNAASFGTTTLVFAGGNLEIRNSSATAYNRPTQVAADATVTLDRTSTGAGVTMTFGTLSIGSSTLSTVGGTNVTSGTAGLTYGATTLTGDPTFNVTNPSGALTQVTLGALGDGGTARTITKTGDGTLFLGTAASSLTAGTTINLNGGRIISNLAGALSNSTASPNTTVNVATGTELRAQVANSLRSSGTGTPNVTVNLEGGTLRLANTGSIAFGGAVVYNSGTLLLDRTASGTAATHTIGSLSLGATTLTPTTANFTTTPTLATGPLALTGDGTLDTTNALITVGALNDGGVTRTLTKQGANTLTLNTAATSFLSTSTLSITGGNATISAANALGSGVGQGGILAVTGGTTTVSAAQTLASSSVGTAGTIIASGAGALGTGTATVNSGGELRGTVANAFSGLPIALSGGTLRLAATTSINTGGTVTYTSGSLTVDRTASGAANTYTLAGVSLGSVTLTPTAANFTATPTLALGTITLTGDAVLDTTNVILTGGGLDDGGVARSLSKQGTNTLTLNSAATSVVNGTTVDVLSGQMAISNATALGTLAAVSVSSGATLSVGAGTTLGSLAGDGTVTASAALTLTIGSSNNLSSTFNGVLTAGTPANLAVTKAGTGTLTLTGSSGNLYTGLTTVSNGTLELGKSAGNAVNGALTITGGATARLLASDQIAASAVTVTNGTLDLQTFSDTVGAVTISAGAITGTGTLTGSSLTKNTAGAASVEAVLAHTGSSTISNGTLTLEGANGALSATSGVTLSPGATLTFDNASSDNSNRLNDSAGVTLSSATVEYIGNAAGSSETAGVLTLNRLGNAINLTHNGGTTALTFASLTRNANSAIAFSATGGSLGTAATGPKILFTTAPTFGGWATVGSDFATYGANGVTAQTAYVAFNTATDTDDATLGASDTLAADKTVNGLKLTGTGTLDLAGYTLTLVGGGLIGAQTGTYILGSGGTGTLASGNDNLFATVGAGATVVVNAPLASSTTLISKSGLGALALNTVTAPTAQRLSILGTGQTIATLNRNTGGTVNFGDANTTVVVGLTSANGIGNAWATFNYDSTAQGADWITYSGGVVGQFTAYDTDPGTGGGGTGVENYLISFNGTRTQTGTINANSLKWPVASTAPTLALDSFDLILTSGGLMRTGATGQNAAISGANGGRVIAGSLATPVELVVFNINNNQLTISAAVVADGLTVGAGTVNFTSTATDFGTGAINAAGGTANLNWSTGGTLGNAFNATGGTLQFGNQAWTLSGAVTLGPGGRILADNNNTVALTGTYTDTPTSVLTTTSFGTNGVKLGMGGTVDVYADITGSRSNLGAINSTTVQYRGDWNVNTTTSWVDTDATSKIVIMPSAVFTGSGQFAGKGLGEIEFSAGFDAGAYAGQLRWTGANTIITHASANLPYATGGNVRLESTGTWSVRTNAQSYANPVALANTTGSTINTQADLTLSHGTQALNFGANAVLSKTGSGVLDITGGVSTAGAATINVTEGTLRLNNALAGDANIALNVNGATAVLDVQQGVTVGAVTLTDGTISGSATLFASSYTASAGAISTTIGGGSANFTKTGAGSVVLSAAASYGGTTAIEDGTVQLSGGGDLLPTATVLTLGSGSTGGTLDLNGQNQQLAGLVTSGSGTNRVVSTVGGATLNVNIASGSNTFGGILGNTGQNGFGLTKLGNGALVLSGANTYTGATAVTAGTLQVSGTGSLAGTSGVTVSSGATLTWDSTTALDVSTVSVQTGGTLNGSGDLSGSLTVDGVFTGSTTLSGSVALNSGASLTGTPVISGAISGAGLVGPGNSPGITTAGQVDVTGGLDFAFEFTQANVSPDYGTPANSINDVLRLTSGTTPFVGTMSAANVTSVYFNVASLTNTDVFTGAWFTDLNSSFLSSISGSAFTYYVKRNQVQPADTTYNGEEYYTLANYNLYNATSLTFNVTVVPETADFGGGPINGRVTQFVVPEPGTLALLSLGSLAILRRRRQQKEL